MKFPRFTVRELVMLVVIVALLLGWAIEHRRAGALAVAVALGDQEIERGMATADMLRAELAECEENFERVDAEIRAGAAAGPR